MDGNKIKEDLISLKERLDTIEGEFKKQLEDLSSKTEHYDNLDKEAEKMISENNHIVRFNVSGQEYSTKIETLLSVKDTFFYHLALSKKVDLVNEEVFLDTEPDIFEILLQFLRTKKLNLKRYDSVTRKKIMLNINYYEINNSPELATFTYPEEIPIIRIENSNPYGTYNQTAPEHLSSKDFTKGVAAYSNATIIFELEEELEISNIHLRALSTSGWSTSYGQNAQIRITTDKKVWDTIGTVPYAFQTTITSLPVQNKRAKFIQITHNSYFGFGYFVVEGQKKLI
jgi:hypothetical protein